MPSDMDDLLKEFLIESKIYLEQFERDIEFLEKRGYSYEASETAFRMVHSIKGASQLFGFLKIESLSREAEALLGLVKEEKMEVSEELLVGLYGTSDALRGLLSDVESSGSEGGSEFRLLLGHLVRLREDPGSGGLMKRGKFGQVSFQVTA